MAETKVTTGEVKLNVINFKGAKSGDFSTSSTSYVDVTGYSVNYTSGPSPEKVFVVGMVMYSQSSGGSGYIRLVGNGVAGSDETYADTVPGTLWRNVTISEWFDWPANTTASIKFQAKVASGTMNISTGGTDTSHNWAPSIKGFAISQ